MRFCIHRGTQEIGGTCVEIEAASGQRIVLDIGLPLDATEADAMPLHPVPGFERPDPSLLGVVISHPHLDHYGLAYRLPKETPFLIGQAAQSILEAAGVFTPGGLEMKNVTHLADRTAIVLGPFTITPYLMDHSAYDAYAILVEADGQRLFYSGDLRAHGRKGKLFCKLLRQPPKDVDVLLMEGTTIGRTGGEDGFPTEKDLEKRFMKLFKQTPGMPLVWCSGQNIDRLVTIYRACKQTGRQLIIDMYTGHVLRATGNKNIPQLGWPGVKVFLPAGQRRQIKRKQAFDLARTYRPWRIFPEDLAAAAPKSVMLFRPTMICDVEEAECLAGSRLIYSMWSGYLKDEKQQPLLQWLLRNRIELDECHTSGHACTKDLVKLRQSMARAKVVPIHSEYGHRFMDIFGDVSQPGDGNWKEVRDEAIVRR